MLNVANMSSPKNKGKNFKIYSTEFVAEKNPFKTHIIINLPLPLISENKHSDVDPNVLNLKW